MFTIVVDRKYIRTKYIETVKVTIKDFTTFRVLGRGGFGAVSCSHAFCLCADCCSLGACLPKKELRHDLRDEVHQQEARQGVILLLLVLAEAHSVV